MTELDDDLSEEYDNYMRATMSTAGKKAAIDFCKGQLKRQLDRLRVCDEAVDAIHPTDGLYGGVKTIITAGNRAVMESLIRAFMTKEGY